MYRAIDSYGNTIDFMLSPKRNVGAVFRFFRKMLGSSQNSRIKVVSVDRNNAYPSAFKDLRRANLKASSLILCSESPRNFACQRCTFPLELFFATEPFKQQDQFTLLIVVVV